MSDRGVDKQIKCRGVRREFSVLSMGEMGLLKADRRALLERHLADCSRCGREYKLFALSRTILNTAASGETITPEKEFFVALRARIARGSDETASPRLHAGDDSWAAVLAMTARQLIPAMAILLALIVSATLIWGNNQTDFPEVAVRPSERVVFGDMYEYPRPTTDDVLETLVAVEETENGR